MEDKDSSVRDAVADGLRGFGNKRTIETLIAALKDQDPFVCVAAAYGLSDFRDPRAIEPLFAAMKDKDPSVRSKAAIALGETKDPRAVEPLIAALKDNNDAFFSLIRIAKAGTEPILINHLNEKNNTKIADALLNSGNSSLQEGARRWAEKRNYRITKIPWSTPIRWGK